MRLRHWSVYNMAVKHNHLELSWLLAYGPINVTIAFHFY